MSKTLRILHVCDHIKRDKEFHMRSKKRNRAFSGNIDIISEDEIVSKIFHVVSNGVIFVEGEDYNPHGHNSISWLGSGRSPLGGVEYEVMYESVEIKTSSHTIDDCPSCLGKGWYINVLESKTNRFLDSKESQKLIQDFIKTLLSPSETRIDIRDLIGTDINNERTIEAEMVTLIRNAEEDCRRMQLELISKGTFLPNSEKLYKVEIGDIELIRDEGKAYVEIIIINEERRLSRVGLLI